MNSILVKETLESYTQDGLVLREESLDMSDQAKTRDNNGVVVACNTPTCLLVEGLGGEGMGREEGER